MRNTDSAISNGTGLWYKLLCAAYTTLRYYVTIICNAASAISSVTAAFANLSINDYMISVPPPSRQKDGDAAGAFFSAKRT
jgi:hypothetical protein